MKKTYLGAISGNEANYGIVFLDFPGCVSAGDTLDEVLAMGREALQGHVELMVEHGDPVPEPTVHSLDDVVRWLDDPEEPIDEPWVGLHAIEVDVPSYPETISVPEKSELVREIAEIVQKNVDALSPRQFIENAARREIERLKKSA
jgi:predicted RNase H-like HicB family nuclease